MATRGGEERRSARAATPTPTPAAMRRKLSRSMSETSEASWTSTPGRAVAAKWTRLRNRSSSSSSSSGGGGGGAENSSSSSSSSGKHRGALMLRRLARQRNERLREQSQPADEERNATLHRLQRLRRKGSSSSSSTASASPSPRPASRSQRSSGLLGNSATSTASTRSSRNLARKPHRESLERRDTSTRRPRVLDEKRVSLRGLTEADGHITRDEARKLCQEELDALDAAPSRSSRSSRSRLSRSRSSLSTLLEPQDEEDEEPLLVGGAVDSDADEGALRQLIRCARRGDTKGLVGIVDAASACLNIDGKSSTGKTALISAAEHGHVGSVIALFGRGADLEATDPRGNTALLRAASKGRHEVLLMLLSAGASDVARNARGESAVVLAAQKLSDAKKHAFDQRLQILLTIFERATPDLETGRIPQYLVSDSSAIKHRRTRELLEEWSVARALAKDLHLPSHSEFHQCNLGEFFKTKHASYDMHIWFKVLLLLCFVVYDTYLKHFESSYKTYIVYALLYFGAYSI